MQVIEVDHVVVHILGAEHQVAHQFSIGRDGDVQRILHGTNRGQGVHSGADPAHPADKGPGIARVATFQDLFQQTDHGPRRIGIGDLAVLNFCFHPQMSLDTGDGIYDQSF